MAFEVYPMDIQRVGAPVRERPELPCTAERCMHQEEMGHNFANRT